MAFALQVSKIENRVPPEVQQVIDNALKGGPGSGFAGFDEDKTEFGFSKSTKLSDVKAGTPVRKYWLNPDSIKKLDEGVPVSALLENLTNEWLVPLSVKGKIINFCTIVKNETSKNQWIMGGMGHDGGPFLARAWQKILKNWPNSAGYYPVFIETGRPRNFFYIPEKDDSNLTYLRLVHIDNDSLELATDTTFSTLTTSRSMLRYLKAPHKTPRLTRSQQLELKKESDQILRENNNEN